MARSKSNNKDLQKIGGIVLGSLLSGIVSKQGEKILPEKIKGFSSALPIVAGWFLKNQKNELFAGAGLGMIAGGSVSLAKQSMPGIFGVGNVPTYRKRMRLTRMGYPANQAALNMPSSQANMNGSKRTIRTRGIKE